MAGRADQIKGIVKRCFDTIDKNGDGNLDRAEVFGMMKGVARAMGQADQIPSDQAEIDAGLDPIFQELDENKDGTISFDEVKAAFKKQHVLEAIGSGSDEEFAERFALAEQIAAAFESGDLSTVVGLAMQIN
eukprot:TRINITY_DN47_c0_g1_i4.p2 TRINITY_DN47_c0_g1~~TRINITY_DN47_c0_g1_i4.p2  ORF type:complete len:132 (-),score=51.18 TRINITY_DN47_c0_g1_i4:364-759(-)